MMTLPRVGNMINDYETFLNDFDPQTKGDQI